jgi:transposase
MENNNLEQRYAIKYCVKLGEGATDTYEKIQKAFGNDSVSHALVFRWHKDFVNGRETVEDKPRSGRPASMRTSTDVGRVRAFIRQDRR